MMRLLILKFHLLKDSYVDTAVANLVDSSPDTLNTLNELAAALGDDPNFATTITTEIGKKANKDEVPTNLVNGRAEGSLRTDFSATESDEYQLGKYSFSEGFLTEASGQDSHSEGYKTKASGAESHAEGCLTVASGDFSHAEGFQSIANISASHAEGHSTSAKGIASHAEGRSTVASRIASHAEGLATISNSSHQHVQGKYNLIIEHFYQEKGVLHSTYENATSYQVSLVQPSINQITGEWESENLVSKLGSELETGDIVFSKNTYFILGSIKETTDTARIFNDERWRIEENSDITFAHIVGNGTSDTNRSNAHTLDWNGNAWYQGEVYVGGSGQDDETAEKLVRKSELDEALTNVAVDEITSDEINTICGATIQLAEEVTY